MIIVLTTVKHLKILKKWKRLRFAVSVAFLLFYFYRALRDTFVIWSFFSLQFKKFALNAINWMNQFFINFSIYSRIIKGIIFIKLASIGKYCCLVKENIYMYRVNSLNLLLRIGYTDKTNVGYNNVYPLVPRTITEFYCKSFSQRCWGQKLT